MTSLEMELKELGRTTQINIHNTRSLIRANTHTHTHTHTHLVSKWINYTFNK